MSEQYKTHEFGIQGMDCLDCASSIEKAVARIKGVKSTKLNFETAKLSVEIEASLDTQKIIQAIKGLGYRVEEIVSGETLTLHIEGMDCSDESEIIEKKLKVLKGIVDFNIFLVSQEVKIQYDPALISATDILKAIAETGMKASRVQKGRHKGVALWKNTQFLLLSICGVFTLFAFLLERFGIPHEFAKYVYALAILIGGYYPAKMGILALKTLTLNIRLLMVCGAAGAIYLGFWDEAAMLVFIYSLGDVLEIYATDRARGSIRALMELAPREALVKRNGTESTLPVEEINIGDVIIIRPGEKVPLDGKVIFGATSIDESPITGESMPKDIKQGDIVYAGAINQRGSIEVEVTKLSKDTTLAKIIHSVEEAQARKSTYQRFGEKFGKYYTPAMFVLAFLVAFITPLFFKQDFASWFYRGLVLLVVSCSCGLALSVPVAVVAAISNAARHGVLIKGGAYLEAASNLRAIAFDKTGTLSIGKPKVYEIVKINNASEEQILALAGSIESRSEHPLGDAIVQYAKERGATFSSVSEFEAIPGRGAKAKINGKIYYIGSIALFKEKVSGLTAAKEEIRRLQDEGKTTVLLGTEEEILGLIAIADQIRPEAKEAIQKLKEKGFEKIIMLTGDNEGTARAIAKELSIDEYRANLLPEDKVKIVRELKAKYRMIAMVGDGVNDAPAMAEANVGIAMGACGTDVCIETGDIALMSDDLLKIPYAFSLSKRSVSNIKQNIFAALLIIIILVPTALLGRIGLVPGLLVNEVSGLIVIINALRLLK